ncbi:MAG: hypothetical protein COA78_10565 [Blastopirellula sp.]|nr:MAG: hypothetical protein COA78_10565 [Blastopirellula sp.]
MSDNPYSPPQAEIGQPAKNLVLAQRSWPVHRVAMLSLAFGALIAVQANQLIAECFVLQQEISNHTEYDSQAKSFDEMILQEQIASTATVLVLAFCLITSGLGVWRRKQWARILSIIQGTLAILFGLLLSMMITDELLRGNSEALTGYVLPVFLLLYGVLVLYVLLRKKYKAEFVGTMPVEEGDS